MILFLQPNWEQSVCYSKGCFSWKEVYFQEDSGSKVHLEEIQEPQIPVKDSWEMDTDSEEVVEPEPITQEPRRSGRIRHEPERYGFLITTIKA